MILYKATCSVNGKAYVGITSRRLTTRWRAHLRQAEKGRGWALHAAIRVHGADAFFVEEIARFSTWEELVEAEVAAITKHRTHVEDGGYNLARGGEGAYGVKRSPEAIAKMRARKPWLLVKREHMEPVWAAQRGIKRGPMSTEARVKMSKATRGVAKSAAHRKAIGDVQRGRPKPKISAALRGRAIPVAVRQRMAAAQRVRRAREAAQRAG